MPKKGDRKCRSCEQYFNEDSFGVYPDGGAIDGKDSRPLCDTCYGEDEEVFTIHFFMPDGSEEKWGIGHYRATVYVKDDNGTGIQWWSDESLDDAQGWRIGWKRTDAWRGYYDETAPDGYTKLGEDAAYGDHASEVEDEDTRLRDVARRLGVELVRCSGRTSNVFSVGVSWWVKGDQDVANKFAEEEDEPWVASHSVNCYFCGTLFDERDGIAADRWNSGDGGTACPTCAETRDEGIAAAGGKE